MAKLKIVTRGDEILNKKCREVEEITPRIIRLLDDMRETLTAAGGAGLAAPQVGVMRRIAIIEYEGDTPEDSQELIELINPKIIAFSGHQYTEEGCLSFPDEWLYTDRPMHVTVRSLNRKGEEYEISASGFLAKALSHEIDHLDGKVMHCRRAPDDKIPQEEEKPRKKRRSK